MEAQNQEADPLSFLHSLILASVRSNAIPGTIVRLRNYAMVFTFASTLVSIFEAVRFFAKIGPLPETNLFVLLWLILVITGSLIATVGTFLLQKTLILLAAILLCCGVAPVTPNMIVLSQGVHSEYYVILSIFWMALGFLEIFIFTHLATELRSREVLSG